MAGFLSAGAAERLSVSAETCRANGGGPTWVSVVGRCILTSIGAEGTRK